MYVYIHIYYSSNLFKDSEFISGCHASNLSHGCLSQRVIKHKWPHLDEPTEPGTVAAELEVSRVVYLVGFRYSDLTIVLNCLFT